MFTYFSIVKAALDSMLPGICTHYGIKPTEALPLVCKHLETMNDEWFSGDKPNIVYQDPLCRFSYLFCHTPANANLCELAIRNSPDVVKFLKAKMDDDEELRVCAFGGGPGTELLALSKHFCKTRPNGPVEGPFCRGLTIAISPSDFEDGHLQFEEIARFLECETCYRCSAAQGHASNESTGMPVSDSTAFDGNSHFGPNPASDAHSDN